MLTYRLLTGILAGALSLIGTSAWCEAAGEQIEAPAATQPSEGRTARTPMLNAIQRHFERAWALRSKLNLTEEQKARIRDTVAAHKEEVIGLLKEVEEKSQTLRDAILDEMPTEETIRAAADQLGKAIGDAAVTASEMADELKKELTTEQREKIRKFREKQRAELHKMLDKALGE